MTSSPDDGTWRGRTIAYVFRSLDGMTILVGRSAADNDVLSIKVGRPHDFWFHAAGHSGAHVVVRNPDRLARLSRATRDLAASLAAGYSGGRAGGRVAVHMAQCRDVSKPRGLAPGRVALRRYKTVDARPLRDPSSV